MGRENGKGGGECWNLRVQLASCLLLRHPSMPCRCKRKVCGNKQLTIEQAPRILTVHLKRFNYVRLALGLGSAMQQWLSPVAFDLCPLPVSKINKAVSFPESLNIASFMSASPPVRLPGHCYYYHLAGYCSPFSHHP